MPTYKVRVWCEDCEEYKRESAQDPLDDSWVPSGCESHTIRDFVIEEENV
jgi:hypothetical protein